MKDRPRRGGFLFGVPRPTAICGGGRTDRVSSWQKPSHSHDHQSYNNNYDRSVFDNFPYRRENTIIEDVYAQHRAEANHKYRSNSKKTKEPGLQDFFCSHGGPPRVDFHECGRTVRKFVPYLDYILYLNFVKRFSLSNHFAFLAFPPIIPFIFLTFPLCLPSALFSAADPPNTKFP